jgi:light-regulated signal transduction histidine kinase (bacteriophytochrome)
MLRLVFVSLISNAIKFMRTPAQADIGIGSVGENTDNLVVFVRDNGVGFDMKYVNKLSGVIQRLRQSDAFEGTGIGRATGSTDHTSSWRQGLG